MQQDGFARGKVNKNDCGPANCAVEQLNETTLVPNREYSLVEAKEIFLWHIWRDKLTQITALSKGLVAHLTDILEDETKGRLQVTVDVTTMLCANTHKMRNTVPQCEEKFAGMQALPVGKIIQGRMIKER